MILPVGLGDRYFKKPWLTFLLIFLNFAVYFTPDIWMPNSKDFKIFKVFKTPAVRAVAQKAFIDYCSTDYSFSPAACAELYENFTELDTDQRIVFQLNSRELTLLNNFYSKKLKTLIPTWPADAREELRKHYEEHHQFSPVNRSPRALIEAEFQHGGLMHLIGNMLFLLLVGVWVEQRISRALYLVFYILGGSLGFLLSSYVELGPLSPLVGASANIATLMGLFTYFFGNYRGKFQFWYIFPLPVMTTFYARMSSVLIPMYFLVDVAGAFNSSGQVAHAAHLGGWLVGMGCGWLVQKKQKIEYPFIHPDEHRWTADLAKIPNPREQLERARYLLDRNRENRWARECIVRNLILDGGDMPQLRAELAPLLSVLAREHKLSRATQILESIPVGRSIEDSVTKLNPGTCRKIFFDALNSGHLIAAERALALYRLRSSRRQKLEDDLTLARVERAEGHESQKFVDDTGEEDGVPARFNQRFLAMVIDGGLTAASVSVLVATLRPLALFLSESYGQVFLNLFAMPFLNLLVLYLLIWKPTVESGQSFGKKALHIRVIDVSSGAQKGLSWSTVILREIVGKTISALILGIGYLMALGPDGLALHDKMLHTRVIQSED